MPQLSTTVCYQCAVMKVPQTDGSVNTLSQCNDCQRLFCHKHANPTDHVFLIGKKETCATRTDRLMRVFESRSVAIPARP